MPLYRPPKRRPFVRSKGFDYGWDPQRYAVNPWSVMLGLLICLITTNWALMVIPWSIIQAKYLYDNVSPLRSYSQGRTSHFGTDKAFAQSDAYGLSHSKLELPWQLRPDGRPDEPGERMHLLGRLAF